MSTDDPGKPPLTEEECRENAAEVVTIMEKALEGALRAAERPGLAIAALVLSTHALRAAIVQKGIIKAEDADELVRWANDLISDEPEVGVANAEREIRRRQTSAAADEDELRLVVDGASACLKTVRQYSETVTGALVLLRVAQHMALAVLKHEHPDEAEYQDAYSTLRFMENAIQPEKIQVVEVKRQQMSKGGDA